MPRQYIIFESTVTPYSRVLKLVEIKAGVPVYESYKTCADIDKAWELIQKLESK